MMEGISVRLKRECCRMKKEGASNAEVYAFFSQNVNKPCSAGSFRSMLSRWMRKDFPDDTTLMAGTYEGFTAHNATVQVSKTGEIVQAWIKQKADDFNPEEFLEAIRGEVDPYVYFLITTPKQIECWKSRYSTCTGVFLTLSAMSLY